MLSYRHAFHAGNPADVLKHVVVVRCLAYLNQKEKPYLVVDTHAGAGRYRLDDASAQKTGEYQQGIARLWHRQDLPEALRGYVQLVKEINSSDELTQYPGSPWLIRTLIREQDRAIFYELHSKDHALLKRHLERKPQIITRCEDGLTGVIALMPPNERRGLVLMDPSYEVKEDYQQVVSVLEKAHRRFATGTFLVWYPVVDRERISAMERAVKRTGIRNIKQFEFSTCPDFPGRGMSASGMFVVNPPWTLEQEMQQILPYLVDVMAPDQGSFRYKTLVAE
ncbi:23S rRNA (adenine(2030)-N(6))-methyltransferase RlmJ [Hydrocarboniclastica marina]|uniref:Ribosomal RNA large subunit methyltransferase J n=1 Tax=Hydrocarboniclastica marina TaxID=2259620 RepID=A0A4P7XFP8_9ALTE|nr:23S rRNA (adenine(2030)-N(6))-methyltransferase RlmJ [Hydrocarboniclastica marina]QCF25799.1 23S rRNA (adenine(2030)-N(6))-methyltransferase RlmJ [Hydrocarboniclastica marina]